MSAGRPRGFDREAAVDAAVALFWRKGYDATSIADLCRAMGIFSPSFYAAFTDKETLYLEAVERYKELRGPVLWGGLEASTAREGVESVLMNTVREHTDPANPPGCLVILSSVAVVEDARLGRHAIDERATTFELFRQRLSRAEQEGELAAGTDVEVMARVFGTVQQGIAIQARDGVPREVLQGTVVAIMSAWPCWAGMRRADATD